MKFLKNNLKVIIGFIVGVVLASSITVYAYSYFAKDISYTKPGTNTPISVETALNDLYNKTNTNEITYRDLKIKLNQSTNRIEYEYNEENILPLYWYGYESFSRWNAGNMDRAKFYRCN